MALALSSSFSAIRRISCNNGANLHLNPLRVNFDRSFRISADKLPVKIVLPTEGIFSTGRLIIGE